MLIVVDDAGECFVGEFHVAKGWHRCGSSPSSMTHINDAGCMHQKVGCQCTLTVFGVELGAKWVALSTAYFSQ